MKKKHSFPVLANLLVITSFIMQILLAVYSYLNGQINHTKNKLYFISASFPFLLDFTETDASDYYKLSVNTSTSII